MRAALAIAHYTFQEAVRNKVLYSILFFCALLMLIAAILGQASLHQDERVLISLGLGGLSLFSDIIAIFLGVTMVYQELERKTIFNVLSKPIQRSTYFLGKFAGMAAVLAVQLGLMAGMLSLIMVVRGDPWPPMLPGAFLLIWIEALFVLSVALFFSSFSTPYVSGFLTLGLWVVAGIVQDIAVQIRSFPEGPLRTFLRQVVALSPDLSVFNLTTQLVSGIQVPVAYLGHASLYGLSLVGLFLMAGGVIFQRRDFI
jgi:ABC-type transport system involved in multi-copper enzyme maturation permease subunit